MSFDLGFWHQNGRPTNEVADQIYARLCDGNIGVVEESQGVKAFFRDVVSIFPDITEENAEESPWASALYRTPECVLVAISWSRRDELVPTLLSLAARHGLTTYDPQEQTVYHPS
jgi:hypothetical protein